MNAGCKAHFENISSANVYVAANSERFWECLLSGRWKWLSVTATSIRTANWSNRRALLLATHQSAAATLPELEIGAGSNPMNFNVLIAFTDRHDSIVVNSETGPLKNPTRHGWFPRRLPARPVFPEPFQAGPCRTPVGGLSPCPLGCHRWQPSRRFSDRVQIPRL